MKPHEYRGDALREMTAVLIRERLAAMIEPKPGDRFWIEFTAMHVEDQLVDGYPTGERIILSTCHNRFLFSDRVLLVREGETVDALIETISDCALCDGMLRSKLNEALAALRRLAMARQSPLADGT